jgi:hypothetical protein
MEDSEITIGLANFFIALIAFVTAAWTPSIAVDEETVIENIACRLLDLSSKG